MFQDLLYSWGSLFGVPDFIPFVVTCQEMPRSAATLCLGRHERELLDEDGFSELQDPCLESPRWLNSGIYLKSYPGSVYVEPGTRIRITIILKTTVVRTTVINDNINNILSYVTSLSHRGSLGESSQGMGAWRHFL